MGCLHSKKDSTDLQTNVFRVVNVDEHGADLCSGQLEITESNIILYREGRESTVWPLHSLRRYGFDGDVFSFESGRRCETGEGIYAFKCRKAPVLFRKLQNQISIRNNASDAAQYPAARLNPSPRGRPTLHASVVHCSSIDNSQPDISRTGNITVNVAMSGLERHANLLRSPSLTNILEVTPLHSRSEATHSHSSNIYQLRGFKREHNNNQDLATDSVHLYSNDLNRDLALLRNKLNCDANQILMGDDIDESFLVESKYANSNFVGMQPRSPLSPTLSSSSEHYAQLSLEQQESARYYINVKLDKTWQDKRNEMIPSTPPTPGGRQVEYSNLSVGTRQEISTYANLSLGEIADSFRNNKQGQKLCTEHYKFSDSDTFTSMSPVEELEVNYAVLDIDGNKEVVKLPKKPIVPPTSQSQFMTSYSSPKKECVPSSSSQKRQLIFQSSVDKTTTPYDSAPPAKNGYTTIDFDKTVALTSVAAESDVDSDGARKMRHNSCNIVCGSPNNGDKIRNNN